MSSDASTKLAITLVATLLAYYSYTAWSSRTMATRRGGLGLLGRGRGGRNRPQPPQQRNGDTAQEPPAESSACEPSVADVLVVKAMLTKALTLPPELVDTIVDFSEYWPHTSTVRTDNGQRGTLVARGGGREENVFVVSRPGRFAALCLQCVSRLTKPRTL